MNKKSNPPCDDCLPPDIVSLNLITLKWHGMLHDREVVCCGGVVQGYQGMIIHSASADLSTDMSEDRL